MSTIKKELLIQNKNLAPAFPTNCGTNESLEIAYLIRHINTEDVRNKEISSFSCEPR